MAVGNGKAGANGQWPVIGHEWAVEHLARALRHRRTRHAYLITGPSRIGKTRLALAFAAALNCTGENPCGECRACKLTLKGVHPDVTIGTRARKAERSRSTTCAIQAGPVAAPVRSPLPDRDPAALPRGEPAAANALLKTLEEPGPSSVLILTADNADALLPTIVSRCQPLHLRPLPVEQVRAALERERALTPTPRKRWRSFPPGESGGRWRRATIRPSAKCATRRSQR